MAKLDYFVTVRSLGSRSTSTGSYLCAWVYGTLCSLVPTSVLDVNGAGLIGGLQAGLVGTFVALPILVPVLLASQIGTDIEDGVARDFFLSGTRPLSILGGGVLAAWMELFRLSTVGVAAAASTGLGDGFRHHDIFGRASVSPSDLLLSALLVLYLSVLSVALMLASRSSVTVVVVAALLLVILLGANPLVDRFGIPLVNSLNPLGVFGTFVPDVAGRFKPDVNLNVWLAAALCWLLLAITVGLRQAGHLTLERGASRGSSFPRLARVLRPHRVRSRLSAVERGNDT